MNCFTLGTGWVEIICFGEKFSCSVYIAISLLVHQQSRAKAAETIHFNFNHSSSLLKGYRDRVTSVHFTSSDKRRLIAFNYPIATFAINIPIHGYDFVATNI
jgi:hypothetical protein